MFSKLRLAFTLMAVASAWPIKFSAQDTISAMKRAADQYNSYSGDGSTEAGWPSLDQWVSWDELWATNIPLMQRSCGWNGWGADNTIDEINGISSAIQALSGQTGVDRRFILAIVMQESKGCVRVPTTNNGVVNPGLMQSHNGVGTCVGASPCPQSQIQQMIADGTTGTENGAGLEQLIKQATLALNDAGSRSSYAAARLYNSGSADYDNLNNGLGSTACYSEDVANRLTGWALAPSKC